MLRGAIHSRQHRQGKNLTQPVAATLRHFAIAIDPAVSSTENSNETSAVVAGLGDKGSIFW
jgi:phage terminase large subunit-like protein